MANPIVVGRIYEESSHDPLGEVDSSGVVWTTVTAWPFREERGHVDTDRFVYSVAHRYVHAGRVSTSGDVTRGSEVNAIGVVERGSGQVREVGARRSCGRVEFEVAESDETFLLLAGGAALLLLLEPAAPAADGLVGYTAVAAAGLALVEILMQAGSEAEQVDTDETAVVSGMVLDAALEAVCLNAVFSHVLQSVGLSDTEVPQDLMQVARLRAEASLHVELLSLFDGEASAVEDSAREALNGVDADGDAGRVVTPAVELVVSVRKTVGDLRDLRLRLLETGDRSDRLDASMQEAVGVCAVDVARQRAEDQASLAQRVAAEVMEVGAGLGDGHSQEEWEAILIGLALNSLRLRVARLELHAVAQTLPIDPPDAVAGLLPSVRQACEGGISLATGLGSQVDELVKQLSGQLSSQAPGSDRVAVSRAAQQFAGSPYRPVDHTAPNERSRPDQVRRPGTRTAEEGSG